MTTEIVEYKPIEAAIAEIQRFKGLVCDVTTPKGLAEAKAAQREVGAVRIALEKTRKKIKEDVLERGRQIDGQSKPLFARIAEIEDPITVQIEAEKRREEEKRQAAIKAEEERIAALERAKKEAEARELAEARAKIAAERADLEKAQAAQREADAKARREREDAERAAQARIDEAERLARLAREEEDRKAKAARQAEEDRLKAERDEIEAQRRVAAEAQRKAREEEEAKAREIQRQQNELVDARGMLQTFKKRFGHRPEFVLVVEAIDECLEIA